VLRRRSQVLSGEVVDRVGGEHPVLDVERRRDHLAQELPPHGLRHDGDDRDRDEEEDQQRRRQQPFRTTRPEPAHVNGSRERDLPQEVRGDQEAADDEEDVDPDVPPREPGRPQVEEQHGAHRDGAECLDVGAELTARRPEYRVGCSGPGSGQGHHDILGCSGTLPGHGVTTVIAAPEGP
jgi:hypothetical protein